VAHRQHQPFGEARGRPAAERQTQMVDDIVQPCCPARPDWENIIAEPFGKNTPPAMRHLTHEPAGDDPEVYWLARARQIRNPSAVSTMDPARCRPAQRALGYVCFGSDHQNN